MPIGPPNSSGDVLLHCKRLDDIIVAKVNQDRAARIEEKHVISLSLHDVPQCARKGVIDRLINDYFVEGWQVEIEEDVEYKPLGHESFQKDAGKYTMTLTVKK